MSTDTQEARWQRIRCKIATLGLNGAKAHQLYYGDTGRRISKQHWYAIMAEKRISEETARIEAWLDRKLGGNT
jgi:hypothetical protein